MNPSRFILTLFNLFSPLFLRNSIHIIHAKYGTHRVSTVSSPPCSPMAAFLWSHSRQPAHNPMLSRRGADEVTHSRWLETSKINHYSEIPLFFFFYKPAHVSHAFHQVTADVISWNYHLAIKKNTYDSYHGEIDFFEHWLCLSGRCEEENTIECEKEGVHLLQLHNFDSFLTKSSPPHRCLLRLGISW